MLGVTPHTHVWPCQRLQMNKGKFQSNGGIKESDFMLAGYLHRREKTPTPLPTRPLKIASDHSARKLRLFRQQGSLNHRQSAALRGLVGSIDSPVPARGPIS
jgi:hypothetical protein